jgi:hypothetical protein
MLREAVDPIRERVQDTKHSSRGYLENGSAAIDFTMTPRHGGIYLWGGTGPGR